MVYDDKPIYMQEKGHRGYECLWNKIGDVSVERFLHPSR